jgi:Inhibitor of growth proteins N-terminal histone-binding
MAYRKMTGAGGGDAQAPSFLDEFLEQIQQLPSQVKAKFAEMREQDDRAEALMSEAERAAAEAVRKAATRSTGGNDPLKKAFQDVLACQAKAGEAAVCKVEIAENAYALIEDTIKSLDEKLREYETQLKKEGRWPAEDRKNEKASARKTVAGSGGGGGGAADAAVASLTKASEKVTAAGAVAPSTKNRKRDREKAEKIAKAAQKAKEKEKEAPAAVVAVGATGAVAGGAAGGAAGPQGLIVIEDANIDPNEERYCYCNQISYGDMVGCEGENCLYEWFHYQCVGLTEEPKGQWFCPECTAKRGANTKRKKKA